MPPSMNTALIQQAPLTFLVPPYGSGMLLGGGVA